jgi:hypothetical protein
MSEISDHAIQNRVRAILFRRWIDLREVTFDSVNGVVTLRGSLARNPLFPAAPNRNGERDPGSLRRELERDLLAIDGVRDLVLDVQVRDACRSCSTGEEES